MPASPVSASRQRRGPVARSLSALAVAVLVLAAPACSSDDDKDASPTTEAGAGGSTTEGDSTETTVDAGPLPELTEMEQDFADAIVESFGEEGQLFSGADNTCLATRWVHAIGEDRLTESGVTAESFALDGPGELELDEATAEEMVDIMGVCGAPIEELYESFAMDFQTGAIDEEILACMEEAAPVAEFRAAMVASFQGDADAAMEAVGKKWEACS